MTPEELRAWAMAAKRVRETWPHESPSDRAPQQRFAMLDHAAAILGLLDALDAARASALEEAAKICEEVERCHRNDGSDRGVSRGRGAQICAAAIRAAKGTTP